MKRLLTLAAMVVLTLFGSAIADAQGVMQMAKLECEQVRKKAPILCHAYRREGVEKTLILRVLLHADMPGEKKRRTQYLVGVLTENFLARGGKWVEQYFLWRNGQVFNGTCSIPRRYGRVWCGDRKADQRPAIKSKGPTIQPPNNPNAICSEAERKRPHIGMHLNRVKKCLGNLWLSAEVNEGNSKDQYWEHADGGYILFRGGRVFGWGIYY